MTMKKFISWFAPLLVALAMFGTAEAREVNRWVHPGNHPLGTSYEQVMNDSARRGHFIRLGLRGEALEAVMQATATRGQMRDLVDGECFDKQAFQSGRVVNNLCVAFGRQQVERRAMRWEVRLTDGTVIEVTLPFVCQNLSITIRRPRPPPPPPACVRIYFNYSANQGVRTSRSEVGQSLDQSFLQPEAEYAFVLAHIDVTEQERTELVADECFGYGDQTGFHRQILDCVEFCVGGSYPDPGMISALASERGLRLPTTQPRGSFRFPLAGRQGYISLPRRFAARYQLYCVESVRYSISLTQYRGWTSNFQFDIVTAEEVTASIRRNARYQGDYVLSDEQRVVRELNGELRF